MSLLIFQRPKLMYVFSLIHQVRINIHVIIQVRSFLGHELNSERPKLKLYNI